LWQSYLTNTMTFPVSQYFIAKTQDEELHAILEYAEEIAKIEVDKSKAFLKEANHAYSTNRNQGSVPETLPWFLLVRG
jgi:hypothetical protein